MTPLLLLALSASGHADPLFGTKTDFTTGSRPRSVAIADLNADGRPDLAVANEFSNTVSVLIGNGDGTFGANTDFGTGSNPGSVAIGDLNADGRPDLAVANFFSNTVSVLLGNGDGTFGTKSDYGTGSTPSSVAIGDLNADGKPDLAVTNWMFFSLPVPSTVSVLLGNGDGTFGTKSDYGVGSRPSSVAIGDLNADGKPDLAVANYYQSNTVSVLLGHGDGTFGTKSDYAAGSPMSVAIGDLNGDGRPDLAVATFGSGAISVLLGNGDGTFSAESKYGAGLFSFSVAIGDLNGDGRPDLAADNYNWAVSVLLGNGDGTFGENSNYATGSDPRSVAIGDLNGDGRPDLAVANQGSNTVSVLLNRTAPIAMGFDFTPNTLNLASRGMWVTAFLDPPSPLAASDIDIASIRLNGAVPVDPAAPTALGDHDGNGVPDLMVKFNRVSVELTLSEGDHVPVNVTGTVDGRSFTGTDDIRVIRAVVSAPAAGSHLTAGSMTQVRWQTPSGVTVQSVALLYSLDGGNVWNLIASGQPNTESYDWTVPNVQTDQAKVAVEMVEPAEENGYVVEGVLGVSEAFSIDAVVGVGDQGPAQFALRGVTPNPAQHELRVSFSLRDSKPATLALFDVSGRQVSSRRVDGMGPGWHTVTLGERSHLRAGLYIIRLTQDGRSLTTRAALVR